MVQDEEVLRIFVDASELNYQGIFGQGACFVGQGEVITKCKKHYNLLMKKQNVYAELAAIGFALEQLLAMHKQGCAIKPEILIYSDIPLVDYLNGTKEITKNKSINIIAKKIWDLKQEFEDKLPSINLQIKNMDPELKKFNPFYKAAHNEARKAINC
ncbi:hypothetical protein [Neobacillus soli]|uniref:hypothetical protein n=1 Tax=Neobacillus soli TaxID=220688 RepID=UPI0012EE434F|nr:hypothetical protein [Neobacillus soli]